MKFVKASYYTLESVLTDTPHNLVSIYTVQQCSFWGRGFCTLVLSLIIIVTIYAMPSPCHVESWHDVNLLYTRSDWVCGFCKVVVTIRGDNAKIATNLNLIIYLYTKLADTQFTQAKVETSIMNTVTWIPGALSAILIDCPLPLLGVDYSFHCSKSFCICMWKLHYGDGVTYSMLIVHTIILFTDW